MVKFSACVRYGILVAVLLLVVAVCASKSLAFPFSLDPRSIAIGIAAKQLAPFVKSREPIVRDWAVAYPHVDSLPGPAFAPSLDAATTAAINANVRNQLGRSTDGTVQLAPGDYRFNVRVFCTDIGRHAAAPLTYELAPLQGARTRVLSAFYSRLTASGIPFNEAQATSWSLQSGLAYADLPTGQQRLIDRLLPDMRGELQLSVLNEIDRKWAALASAVPGLPTLDSSLNRLGHVGDTIRLLRDARDYIAVHSGDVAALRSRFAPIDPSSHALSKTTWSVVAPGIYERLRVGGALGSVGVLELRVAHQTTARRTKISGRRELASMIAQTPNALPSVPLVNNVAYPPACQQCQPLTYTPETPKTCPLPALPPADPGQTDNKNQQIYDEALAAENTLCTSNTPGTQGGSLGCAEAVNQIVENATGSRISNGMSTNSILNELQGGAGTEIQSTQATPGTIIISPSTPSQHGHVGICMTGGCTKIASNSSKSGCVKQNFTLNSWKNTYSSLPTQFFNVK